MKAVSIGPANELSEAAARERVRPLLAKIQTNIKTVGTSQLNDVLDRYLAEEHIPEIIAGNRPHGHSLKFSTAYGYRIIIEKYLRPQWGGKHLDEIRPAAAQAWFNELPVSAKYKSKIRAVLHRLFEKAMLWEFLKPERNPISLIEIRGSTLRARRPMVLTPEQFNLILSRLPQPHRTMVLVAQCLGLRVNEILGLRWTDLDLERCSIFISRGVVNGRVDVAKTEYSADELPLAPELFDAIQFWRTIAVPNVDNWMFANPRTLRPYNANALQKRWLLKIGRELELPENLGWHCFRHTYRSWLDFTGASVGVQQRLMRHAHVSTTMNIYGDALMHSKRDAHRKVVELVLASK